MVIRVLISFIVASNFTFIFYGDFFLAPQDNKILVWIWGIPCFHLLVNSSLLACALIGSHYTRHDDFLIVRKWPFPKSVFRSSTLKRFFVLVTIDGENRILSCISISGPTSIITYRDSFNRLRILSFGNLSVRFLWIGLNLIVVGVLPSAISAIRSL